MAPGKARVAICVCYCHESWCPKFLQRLVVPHPRDPGVLLFYLHLRSCQRTSAVSGTQAQSAEPAPQASRGPDVKLGSPTQPPPSSVVSFPLEGIFPSKGPQLGQHQSFRDVPVKVSQERERGYNLVPPPLRGFPGSKLTISSAH